jgi:hypothetical protein
MMPGMTAVSEMFYADNPDRFKITRAVSSSGTFEQFEGCLAL